MKLQTSKLQTKTNLIILVNSVSYALIAVCSIVVFRLISAIFIGKVFSLPTTVLKLNVYYMISNESWSVDMVNTIYSFPIIALFILAIIFLVLYIKTVTLTGLLRLYLMWGSIYAFAIIFGSTLLGSILYEDIGIVFSYLYMSQPVRIFVLFLSASILVFFGLVMKKYFYFSANIYFEKLESRMDVKFSFFQFLLPFLIVTLLMYFIYYKNSFFNIAVFFAPMMILFPSFNSREKETTLYFEERTIEPAIHKAAVIVALVFFVFIKILSNLSFAI